MRVYQSFSKKFAHYEVVITEGLNNRVALFRLRVTDWRRDMWLVFKKPLQKQVFL